VIKINGIEMLHIKAMMNPYRLINASRFAATFLVSTILQISKTCVMVQTRFFFSKLAAANRCRFFQDGILPGKAHLNNFSHV
jgi:hypothetical protein